MERTVDLTAVRPNRRPGIGRVGRNLLRFARKKPLGAVGAIILFGALVCALFAPQVAPYTYQKTQLSDKLEGPSPRHLFGTDQLGRDLFSRVVYGARISVIVGVTVVVIALALAVLLGAVPGYTGRFLDMLLSRVVDAWLALPTLMIALTLVAVFGQGLRNVIVVLALATGIQFSRIARSAVIAIKDHQYVEAARATGASGMRVFFFHILPNVVPVLIVLATSALGSVILAEASLSFLGFGVPPPQPTWGGLLTGSAVNYMVENPWMVIWPGLAISLTVYGANMLGDALRDVLDPRLRGV